MGNCENSLRIKNIRKRVVFIVSLVLLLSVALGVLTACGKGNAEQETEKYPLSNANASAEAKAVYTYICGLEGSGTLSGQQESTWMGSPDYEMDYIFDNTGKYPAIRGFDYMGNDFDGVNERAEDWWDEGGIVTICWHTGVDFSSAYTQCKEDEIDDWDALLTEGTDEYNALIAGMDRGAEALKVLCDAGVPVLWRPFHEFDGNWFWWSKGSPASRRADCFVKLWQIMYDRYTNYWHLNNLIWVAGYSEMPLTDKLKWYPGDGYCDVIGSDSYVGVKSYLYDKVRAVSATKPMCFHECGTNPTVAELQQYPFVWFMTWHTNYLTDENEVADLNTLYNSDWIITRDELPKFK